MLTEGGGNGFPLSLRTRCWLQNSVSQEFILYVGETLRDSPQCPGSLAASRHQGTVGQPHLGWFRKWLVTA